LSKGFLQANGALERRGIEVDHTFYLPKENMQLGPLAAAGDAESEDADRAPVRSAGGSVAVSGGADAGLVQELQQQLQRMQRQSEQLQEALDAVRRRLDRLERELGIG